MKKLILGIFLILSILGFSANTKNDESKIRQTVEAVTTTLNDNNMLKLLVNSMSFENGDLSEAESKKIVTVFFDFLEKTKSEISKIDVKGNSATVTLKIRTPDIESYVPSVTSNIQNYLSKYKNFSKKEIQSLAATKLISEYEKIFNGNVKYITKSMIVEMEKSGGEWGFKNTDDIIKLTQIDRFLNSIDVIGNKLGS